MKKNSLMLFCGFILGIITFKAIDVNAEVKYNSDQILYQKGDEQITVTNVLDSLNSQINVGNVVGKYTITGSCSGAGSSGSYIWGTNASASTNITLTINSDGTITATGNLTGSGSAHNAVDNCSASCSSTNLTVTKK